MTRLQLTVSVLLLIPATALAEKSTGDSTADVNFSPGLWEVQAVQKVSGRSARGEPSQQCLTREKMIPESVKLPAKSAKNCKMKLLVKGDTVAQELACGQDVMASYPFVSTKITFSGTTFEGVASWGFKTSAKTKQKMRQHGMSLGGKAKLTGKRIGDCPEDH